MNATDAVKKIMKDNNLKGTTVSAMIGMTKQAYHMRINQTNISVEKLNEILKVMDYKIVIMPSDGQLPEGAIEIE